MDQLTIEWFGCSTFRLNAAGVSVFLDAYIDRVEGADGYGKSAGDIDRADWILVGHSHFDHLWGAERIARNTGATVVGSFETIRVMKEAGVPLTQLLPVSGGERIALGPQVFARVFPSLHSCVWTHRALPPVDEICIGDLGVIYQDRIERGQQQADYVLGLGSTVASHLSSGNQNARGDGGALVYLIEAPAGRLLFQDTCGHWSGIMSALRPDIALLAAAGRPNLDGEPFQGTLADYLVGLTGLIRPRQLILTHHDDWLPGFSSRIDTGIVRHEMAQAGLSTVLTDLPYWETVALHS